MGVAVGEGGGRGGGEATRGGEIKLGPFHTSDKNCTTDLNLRHFLSAIFVKINSTLITISKLVKCITKYTIAKNQ